MMVTRAGADDDEVDAETGREGRDRDEETDEEEEALDAHLSDVEVGAGCTEIWEHLSEQRDED